MSIKEEKIIGDCRLLLGDCLEIMPELGKVDCVITDPPYGINWKPRINHKDQPWVDEINFDIMEIIIGRYNLVWGAQYFANKLPLSQSWLTWCKRPLHCDFSMDSRTYATTELAWRDWGKSKFMSLTWDGGKRAGQKDNRTFCHPSQKPVELMKWCIKQLPVDAGTILDPFMGSGTTGVACAQLGRKFIGIEIEERYFNIAVDRITRAYQQLDLFIKPSSDTFKSETPLLPGM